MFHVSKIEASQKLALTDFEDRMRQALKTGCATNRTMMTRDSANLNRLKRYRPLLSLRP